MVIAFMYTYTAFMAKNVAAVGVASTPARALGVLALCFFFNFVSRGIGDTYMSVGIEYHPVSNGCTTINIFKGLNLYTTWIWNSWT